MCRRCPFAHSRRSACYHVEQVDRYDCRSLDRPLASGSDGLSACREPEVHRVRRVQITSEGEDNASQTRVAVAGHSWPWPLSAARLGPSGDTATIPTAMAAMAGAAGAARSRATSPAGWAISTWVRASTTARRPSPAPSTPTPPSAGTSTSTVSQQEATREYFARRDANLAKDKNAYDALMKRIQDNPPARTSRTAMP